METVTTPVEVDKTDLRTRMTPPVHSDISAVLNGVSNGAMVVGVPLLVWEVLRGTHKPLTMHNKVSMTVGAIGCVVGAVFGLKEAQLTADYRRNMADEIIKLRGEVDHCKRLHTETVLKQREAEKSTAGVAV